MPENYAAIVVAADHHQLSKIKDVRGTTHTVGALRCKFKFRTNDWLNAAKTAMFCNGDVNLHPEIIDNAISVPLDQDDECAVPCEVLQDTLPYSIGVWGITPDGFRIVSRWLVFGMQQGCYSEGTVPGDPEPTIYEEILSSVQSAVRVASRIEERANSGEFNGPAPYVGDNGNWWIDNIDTGVKAQGKDGVGVSNIVLSKSNELVIIFSDGTEHNAGQINITKSAINGNLKVGDTEIEVYTHPQHHSVADIENLQTVILAVKDDIIGTEDDTPSADTIHGAKKLTEEFNADLVARIQVLENDLHEHSNKDVLDGITAEKIAIWDTIQNSAPKMTTITLPATNWMGSANPWSQTVPMNSITVNSKLDLQPTASQIVALQNYETTLMLQNDGGIVTAWAIGNKPIEDYTMQVLITEVMIV